jgi:hypothetical protein
VSTLRWGLAVIGFVTPMLAVACGACVEDTVAATYDHAVVERAAAKGNVLVYASIDGTGDPRALADQARASARRVVGVDRASVRVSAAPLALSFAIDPKAQTVDGAIASVQLRSHDRGIRLTVVRVAP